MRIILNRSENVFRADLMEQKSVEKLIGSYLDIEKSQVILPFKVEKSKNARKILFTVISHFIHFFFTKWCKNKKKVEKFG